MPFPATQFNHYNNAQSLGGGTSSTFKITSSEANSPPLVLKYGANPQAMKIEILCNAIYRLFADDGMHVPESTRVQQLPSDLAKQIDAPQDALFQISEYIQPKLEQDNTAIQNYAKTHFVLHAFLGNIDANKADNFIQAQDNKIYLIDAGSNFIFRALGGNRLENASDVSEIDTMRSLNQAWFGDITQEQIKQQVIALLNKAHEIEILVHHLTIELDLPDDLHAAFIQGLYERLDQLMLRFYPEHYTYAKVYRHAKDNETAAGVLTYTIKNDEPWVLLTRRIDHKASEHENQKVGLWDCFGGSSENEDKFLHYTAAREVNEESSQQFTYTPLSLLNSAFCDNITTKNNKPFLYRMYFCEHQHVDFSALQAENKLTSFEHTAFEWVRLADLEQALKNHTPITDANGRKTLEVKPGMALYPEFHQLLQQSKTQDYFAAIHQRKTLSVPETQGLPTKAGPARYFHSLDEYAMQTVRTTLHHLPVMNEMKSQFDAQPQQPQTSEVFETQTELHLRSMLGDDYNRYHMAENVTWMFDNTPLRFANESQKINFHTHCLRLMQAEKIGGSDRVYFYHGCAREIAFAYDVYTAIYRALQADDQWHAFRSTHNFYKSFLNITEFIAHFSKNGAINNYSNEFLEMAISANWALFGNHESRGSYSPEYFLNNTSATAIDLAPLLETIVPVGLPETLKAQLMRLFKKMYPAAQNDENRPGVLYQLSLSAQDADTFAYTADSGGPLKPYVFRNSANEECQTHAPSQIAALARADLASGNESRKNYAIEFLRNMQIRLMVSPHLQFIVNQITEQDLTCIAHFSNKKEDSTLLNEVIYEMLLNMTPDTFHPQIAAGQILKGQALRDKLPLVHTISLAMIKKAFIAKRHDLIEHYCKTANPALTTKLSVYALALCVEDSDAELAAKILTWHPKLRTEKFLPAGAYNYVSQMQNSTPATLTQQILAKSPIDINLIKNCLDATWPYQMQKEFKHTGESLALAITVLTDSDHARYQYAMTHLPLIDKVESAEILCNALPSTMNQQFVIENAHTDALLVREMVFLILKKSVETQNIPLIRHCSQQFPQLLTDVINVILLSESEFNEDLMKELAGHNWPSHMTEKSIEELANRIHSINDLARVLMRLPDTQSEMLCAASKKNIYAFISEYSIANKYQGIRIFFSKLSPAKVSLVANALRTELTNMIFQKEDLINLLQKLDRERANEVVKCWKTKVANLLEDTKSKQTTVTDNLLSLIRVIDHKILYNAHLLGKNELVKDYILEFPNLAQYALDLNILIRNFKMIAFILKQYPELKTQKVSNSYSQGDTFLCLFLIDASNDAVMMAECFGADWPYQLPDKFQHNENTLTLVLQTLAADKQYEYLTKLFEKLEYHHDFDSITTTIVNSLSNVAKQQFVENIQENNSNNKFTTITKAILKSSATHKPNDLAPLAAQSLACFELLAFDKAFDRAVMETYFPLWPHTLPPGFKHTADSLAHALQAMPPEQQYAYAIANSDHIAHWSGNIESIYFALSRQACLAFVDAYTKDKERSSLFSELVYKILDKALLESRSHEYKEIIATNKLDFFNLIKDMAEKDVKLFEAYFGSEWFNEVPNGFEHNPLTLTAALNGLPPAQRCAYMLKHFNWNNHYSFNDEAIKTLLHLIPHNDKVKLIASYINNTGMDSVVLTILKQAMVDNETDIFKPCFSRSAALVEFLVSNEKIENILIFVYLGENWPLSLPNEFKHTLTSLTRAIKLFLPPEDLVYALTHLPKIESYWPQDIAKISDALSLDSKLTVIAEYEKGTHPYDLFVKIAQYILEDAVIKGDVAQLQQYLNAAPTSFGRVIELVIDKNPGIIANIFPKEDTQLLEYFLVREGDFQSELLVKLYGEEWTERLSDALVMNCAKKIDQTNKLTLTLQRLPENKQVSLLCEQCKDKILTLIKYWQFNSLLNLLSAITPERVRIVSRTLQTPLRKIIKNSDDFSDALRLLDSERANAFYSSFEDYAKNGSISELKEKYTFRKLKQDFNDKNFTVVMEEIKESLPLAEYGVVLCVKERNLEMTASIVAAHPELKHNSRKLMPVSSYEESNADNSCTLIEHMFSTGSAATTMIATCFGNTWQQALPPTFVHSADTLLIALSMLPEDQRLDYAAQQLLHLKYLSRSNANSLIDFFPNRYDQLIMIAANSDSSTLDPLIHACLKKLINENKTAVIMNFLDTTPRLNERFIACFISLNQPTLLRAFIERNPNDNTVFASLLESPNNNDELLVEFYSADWKQRITPTVLDRCAKLQQTNLDNGQDPLSDFFMADLENDTLSVEIRSHAKQNMIYWLKIITPDQFFEAYLWQGGKLLNYFKPELIGIVKIQRDKLNADPNHPKFKTMLEKNVFKFTQEQLQQTVANPLLSGLGYSYSGASTNAANGKNLSNETLKSDFSDLAFKQ